jgi:hypothetical protein
MTRSMAALVDDVTAEFSRNDLDAAAVLRRSTRPLVEHRQLIRRMRTGPFGEETLLLTPSRCLHPPACCQWGVFVKILLVQPAPFEPGRIGLENSLWLSEPVALTQLAAMVPDHEVRILDMRLEPDLVLNDTLLAFLASRVARDPQISVWLDGAHPAARPARVSVLVPNPVARRASAVPVGVMHRTAPPAASNDHVPNEYGMVASHARQPGSAASLAVRPVPRRGDGRRADRGVA